MALEHAPLTASSVAGRHPADCRSAFAMVAFDAVLFDAVGTLIEPHPSVDVAYATAGRRHGSRLDEATILHRFRTAFARQEQRDAAELDHQTSEARERQRWRQIVAEVFAEVVEVEPLFRELWDHFAQPCSWRLYDDVLPALEWLRLRGVAVGIASNFDERLPQLWQVLAPDTCEPGRVFVSSAIGWRKPHRKFFHSIEQRLGHPPDRLLLVGDDPENDQLAATTAGWNATLINRSAGQTLATIVSQAIPS